MNDELLWLRVSDPRLWRDVGKASTTVNEPRPTILGLRVVFVTGYGDSVGMGAFSTF
jgi:hypothetical protein